MYRAIGATELLLLFAGGCAPLHYPSIKAVDLKTGEVLKDAYVELGDVTLQPGMPSLIPTRLTMRRKKFETDEAGTITIQRVSPFQRLDVACDGYKAHSVEYPWRQRLNPLARVFGSNGAYYESGSLVVPLKPKYPLDRNDD